MKQITVGLSATAKFITEMELNPVLNFLKKNNINYKFAKNIFTKYHQFAGNDDFRAEGFIELLQDKEINFIWSVRGGYGTTRIIDKITPYLKKYPKIIIGYSDLTALLMEATNNNITSIHATMPINFAGEKKQSGDSFSMLINLLKNRQLSWNFKAEIYNTNATIKFKTKILGGNLSLLAHLCGTPTYRNINWEDFVLLIEDIDEYLYAIDRYLVQLQRTGILSQVKAILVGEFTNTQDNDNSFGLNIVEMLREKTNVPIITGVPVGHGINNLPVVFNKEISIEISDSGVGKFTVFDL